MNRGNMDENQQPTNSSEISIHAALTLILLSFIWIFLETKLAQYFSPRKSQNILPRKALTHASGSTIDSEVLRTCRRQIRQLAVSIVFLILAPGQSSPLSFHPQPRSKLSY